MPRCEYGIGYFRSLFPGMSMRIMIRGGIEYLWYVYGEDEWMLELSRSKRTIFVPRVRLGCLDCDGLYDEYGIHFDQKSGRWLITHV